MVCPDGGKGYIFLFLGFCFEGRGLCLLWVVGGSG